MMASSREKQAVFVRKWAGFVSALWLMLFCGCYMFPNYSEALKELLGINQKQLNGLSIAKDLGDSCGGILAGILSNYLPAWALLCISGSVGVLGYGMQWLVVSHIIKPLPYWMMFMAAITSGSSISWMNVAVFNASVRNFTRNRGPVAGLFKACMGLSAAVFSIFGETFFSSSASVYLLMLVIIPTTFCIVSAVLFRPVLAAETQEEQQEEQKSLLLFSMIASGLAIYILILTFLPNDLQQSSAYRSGSMLFLMVFLGAPAVVPFLLFFKVKKHESHEEDGTLAARESNGDGTSVSGEFEENSDSNSPSCVHKDDHPVLSNKDILDSITNNGLTQPLLDMHASSFTMNASSDNWWCCTRLSSSGWIVEDLGEDKATLSLFKTWHYYVLYFSLFCGCGSGVAFTNNLGQVGQALGFSSVNLFASLFSLGNFFGRLASGFASEYFLKVAGMPRPAWMGLAKVPMIVSFLWLSTGSMASLYAGSLVLGFCHGSLITLTIPIVSEFYGLAHFGTNFMLTVTHLLLGSYVFSSMAGYLFDRQALLEGGLTCDGSKCYGATFQILASCLTIALAFDALLTFISRPLYQKLKLKHVIRQ